jgi:hypothetical protein
MNKLFLLAAIAIAIGGCTDDDVDDINDDEQRTFKVVVENVSTSTTLEPGAMPDRTAPISQGVWAVYRSGNLFTVDHAASEGTERIAEEGLIAEKADELSNAEWVKKHGEIGAPGGPDNGPNIFVGESATFMVSGGRTDKLQIMCMFGQSNDWFYAFGRGGLLLFDGNTPVEGDVTSKIVLYDAGTEQDEAPGLGLTQAPDHPGHINVGPDDSVNQIKDAMTRHSSSFTIPANNAVIKVTITPQ